MELGSSVDKRGLLHDDESPPSWWELWLCGRSDRALHIDALRAVHTNLVFELIGAASLVWTLCTEKIHWRDVWDGVDLLLALPTLFALLSFSADPPLWLARWCLVLLAFYVAGVAFDVAWLLLGRWSAAASRSMTALSDAGALCMWLQCAYFNQQLARALARQAPIAYVTVGTVRHQVEARLPG